MIGPGSSYPPINHPIDHLFSWENGRILQNYQVLFLSQGSGTFESAHAGSVPLHAGDLFLLFPGEWHRYKPNEATGWVEDWIEISGSTIENLHHSGVISPSAPVYSPGIEPEIVEVFDRCRRLVQEESADFTTKLGLHGLQLISIAEIANVRSKAVNSALEIQISTAKSLIGERISETLVMPDLAEEIGINYSSFRRAFKELTGITPKQYQLQLRHRKAQDLLANTGLNLDEIASLLGFDTAFHLSADFKKRVGISPKDWRATYRKTHQAHQAF